MTRGGLQAKGGFRSPMEETCHPVKAHTPDDPKGSADLIHSRLLHGLLRHNNRKHEHKQRYKHNHRNKHRHKHGHRYKQSFRNTSSTRFGARDLVIFLMIFSLDTHWVQNCCLLERYHRSVRPRMARVHIGQTAQRRGR